MGSWETACIEPSGDLHSGFECTKHMQQMFKHAHAQISALSYGELNENPAESLKKLDESVRGYVADVNGMLRKHVNDPVKKHATLVATCAHNIPTTLPPDIPGSQLRAHFLNYLQPWYSRKGLDAEFDVLGKNLYVLQAGQRPTRTLSLWCAVHSHMCIIARAVSAYFGAFSRTTDLTLDVISKDVLLLIREANFACSLFLGDAYTEYCHAVMCTARLFSARVQPLELVLQTYILILDAEFEGKCPPTWRFDFPT